MRETRQGTALVRTFQGTKGRLEAAHQLLKKLKIGILTQYYEPEIGAPQARLSALARGLVERGHEVQVLTAMPNYPIGRVYSGYGGAFRREVRSGVRILRT